MYIGTVDKKNFIPFSIVLQKQEEVEHLLYKLCFVSCSSDPLGIEMQMRILILGELQRQGVDITGYQIREEQRTKEFKLLHKE